MRRDQDRISQETEGFSNKRADALADDLQFLLGDLCRNWGFCSALADDLLAGGEPLTPDRFATAVLAAEGWPEPNLESEWRAKLRRVFTARYGAAVSADRHDPR